MLSLLNRLSDVQLQAALDGTLTVGDLSAGDRTIFMRNMLNWNGTKSGGWTMRPEEVLALHAKAGNGALIKLSLSPKYTAQIEPGRPFSTYDHERATKSDDAAFLSATIKQSSLATSVAARAKVGLPLDFEAGEAPTVADFLRRANRELNVRYRIDGHILDDRIFVSGSYDADSFQAAAEIALKLRQLQQEPALDTSLEAARSTFDSRIESIIDDDELVEPDVLSLGALAAEGRSSVAAQIFRKRFGLDTDHRIRVSSGYSLTLFSGPGITIGERQVILNGKERTVEESIDSRISIRF